MVITGLCNQFLVLFLLLKVSYFFIVFLLNLSETQRDVLKVEVSDGQY